MAGIIPVGAIAKLEEDPFPSTGAHFDVRVKQGEKYIDPMTAKSIVLQNIVVGKDKIPLVEQRDGEFKTNFPITSPYGKRTAPVAGASTFHRGTDFGISGGTPLFYKGPGKFEPGKGMGTLETTVAGVPYTLEFLHIKPGQHTEVLDQQQKQVTQTPAQTSAKISDQPININLIVPGGITQKRNPKDFLDEYMLGMIGQPQTYSPYKSNAADELMRIASQRTNYFG